MKRDHAFPDRAVRVIDPFGAGGGVDVIARAIAGKLSEMWGHRAIVENHPGGGSTAAPALVATAPADGYTLLINTSAHAYSAALGSHLPYHPLRDFAPVAALTSQPYVLVAGARSGITTVTDLIAAAEARPGEIRFASAGKGTGTHIAVEKLNRDLRITALHTPARATDAITDVIEGTAVGRTEYAMLPIPTATPRLQDGGLVALGVSTQRRSRLLPDVPPLAEAGVAGFDFPIWYGIWAPAATPPEIVSKLARDISNALATPELLEWLKRHDADPMNMTRTEFAGFVESESERAALLLSSGGTRGAPPQPGP
jgi:tripartite-type tricarboxylate transporter receptor subunit TctC